MKSIHLYEKDPEIRKRLKETSGLGTAATQAAIIETLKARGYVAKKGSNLVSTQKGRSLIAALPHEIKSPGLTALFEELLESIALGRSSPDEFKRQQKAFVEKFIQAPLNFPTATAPGGDCPTCGKGYLKKRDGTNGIFWGCSAYPECRATFENKRGKPDVKSKELPKKTAKIYSCKTCGKELIRRTMKREKKEYFWGCSGFPECRATASDKRGKPVLS